MNSNADQSKNRELLIAFAFSIFFVRFNGFIVNLAMPTFVQIFNITVS